MIIFILICLSFLSVLSQPNSDKKEPILAYSFDGMWYFIDFDGKTIFEPKKLDDVLGYSEGLIRIAVNENNKNRVKYLDLSGEVVLEPQFDYAYDFINGLAMVFKFTDKTLTTKRFGFIDKTGKPIVPCNLNDASEFSEGLAYVSNDEFRGYIDSTGKLVINLQGNAGNRFSDGFAAVNNKNYSFGFINTKGDLVIDYKFDEAGPFSEGIAKFNRDNKFGFIDKTSKEIIKPSYDIARNFSEGRAFVGLYDINFRAFWAVVDTNGKMISKHNFTRVQDFSGGLAAVREINEWGFINHEGEYKIKPRFFYADSFFDGIAWASDRVNKEAGFIDFEGNFKIKIPEFDKAFELRFNRKVY